MEKNYGMFNVKTLKSRHDIWYLIFSKIILISLESVQDYINWCKSSNFSVKHIC